MTQTLLAVTMVVSVRITAAKTMAVQTTAVVVVMMIMAIVPAVVVVGAVPVMAMAPCRVHRIRRLIGHSKGGRRRTPGFLMRTHLKHLAMFILGAQQIHDFTLIRIVPH